MNRRRFLHTTAASAAAFTLGSPARSQGTAETFKLNYILGSAMYGELPIETVIAETPKTGAKLIDIWPRKHGSQREQMDEIGHDKVAGLLQQHGVQLACITRYDLGPFNLTDEFAVAQKFGAKLIVTGAKGPKGLEGAELKNAVKTFSEELKPHLAKAAEHDITIVIENHGNNLIESPDSIRWLLEFTQDQPLGIELAPYHLPQDPALLAGLIRDLGNRMKMFLAWQYGKGCMKPMPKDEELEQMPGRGPLDFKPLLQALKDIHYSGNTQIFMHPTPRGIPILPTAEATTAEITKARSYLENILPTLS
jgi:sugar phosphate isomerase/epimerase